MSTVTLQACRSNRTDMDGAPEFQGAGRDQAFGYTCGRCLKCCRHKRIQLNPYEVARMARARAMTTTAFRARYTLDGAGVELAQVETGDCVFLGADGCTVHADRPLVCRLYPLGRFVDFDGIEVFRTVQPHPDSAGLYHDRGSVGAFLDSQGAAPFIQAADAYLAWLARALAQLSAATGRASDALLGPAEDDGALTDMDGAIAAHCDRTGALAPDDLEARRELHLAILYDHLKTQEGKHRGI